jgi:peptide-methionine (R)-S-oxide reductase
MNILTRRSLLGAAALAPLLACSPAAEATGGPAQASEQRFARSPWRSRTDAQWRQQLSPASFDVLRREGTERPGSSPLLNEHRAGTFVCMGCGLPLFRSQWKFDSGTGWPSFFDVIHQNIGTKEDDQLIEQRTEYHCAQCLGHQGHVFPDGPAPTGLRYCNDGVALRFVPA